MRYHNDRNFALAMSTTYGLLTQILIAAHLLTNKLSEMGLLAIWVLLPTDLLVAVLPNKMAGSISVKVILFVALFVNTTLGALFGTLAGLIADLADRTRK